MWREKKPQRDRIQCFKLSLTRLYVWLLPDKRELSHVSSQFNCADSDRRALRDSSPTARLPCNLEKESKAVEYISRDRLSTEKRLTDTVWRDGNREVLSTLQIKSFTPELPCTNSNLIPSLGLARDLLKSYLHTHTHISMARHGHPERKRIRGDGESGEWREAGVLPSLHCSSLESPPAA